MGLRAGLGAGADCSAAGGTAAVGQEGSCLGVEARVREDEPRQIRAARATRSSRGNTRAGVAVAGRSWRAGPLSRPSTVRPRGGFQWQQGRWSEGAASRASPPPSGWDLSDGLLLSEDLAGCAVRHGRSPCSGRASPPPSGWVRERWSLKSEDGAWCHGQGRAARRSGAELHWMGQSPMARADCRAVGLGSPPHERMGTPGGALRSEDGATGVPGLPGGAWVQMLQQSGRQAC